MSQRISDEGLDLFIFSAGMVATYCPMLEKIDMPLRTLSSSQAEALDQMEAGKL
mgnify:CR=1 FL=1